MRVIFARLSCVYSGRVDANLSIGDYLLLLRDPARGGDGSCLVYSTTTGLGARNWMPTGSAVFEHADGFTIEHRARGERLDIFIERTHFEMDATPQLEGELTKMGSEREFSDLIAQHLHLVDPRLRLVGREAHTPAGPVDLLCTDSGRPVAIEVKRRRITPSDAWQLRRYLDSISRMEAWADAPEPRGILLAPVLAKKAKLLIDSDPRLEFCRLAYEDLRDLPAPSPEAEMIARALAARDKPGSNPPAASKPEKPAG